MSTTTNTMVLLTDNERQAIYDNMVAILNEYDYDWSASALHKIIDEWSRNKSDLIGAFKKHPKYVDGKFLIAFDMDYERGIEYDTLRMFRHWVCTTCASDCQNNLPEEIRKATPDWRYVPYEIGDLLACIDDWNARTLKIDWAHAINSTFTIRYARR